MLVSDKVSLRVLEISILSKTLGHGVVDRLVSKKKTLMDSREVDEQGGTEEDCEDQEYREIGILFFGKHM